MMVITKEFFEMPMEDQACLYSEDLKQPVQIYTSFNLNKFKVLNWVEYLTQTCHPLEEVIGAWPQNLQPTKALELESDYLDIILGKRNQQMNLNYYPSCTNRDLTQGLASHSDASALTVLMEGDVSALQVFKNRKWFSIEPIANTFVVNLGDQLQVVSNERFRSVEHREITNMDTVCISIFTFCHPRDDAFIAPATSMVNEQ
eukprot:PITA_20746